MRRRRRFALWLEADHGTGTSKSNEDTYLLAWHYAWGTAADNSSTTTFPSPRRSTRSPGCSRTWLPLPVSD
ncbi:hypothetical protein [Kutzneria sp. CA-103260]|uniref:hypothetical protein n=1 Tax=Kutzneria sp. CA-103260 TaxID=2802641 RepID=UPI001BA47B22|nr:hypothetical protein [Kutzneria sp. CA-103260]QUQ64204.1 hypothetical protein JJ691_19240 [Kutzneria sp. CA-103260]